MGRSKREDREGEGVRRRRKVKAVKPRETKEIIEEKNRAKSELYTYLLPILAWPTLGTKHNPHFRARVDARLAVCVPTLKSSCPPPPPPPACGVDGATLSPLPETAVLARLRFLRFIVPAPPAAALTSSSLTLGGCHGCRGGGGGEIGCGVNFNEGAKGARRKR